MKWIVLIAFFFTLPAFACACFKVEGSLGVDGETWKIDQRLDHNKEFFFPMGTFILKLKVSPGKKKLHTLYYDVKEKKGTTLTAVTEGDEEIKEGEEREIFAKGKEGQPNSILTIKVLPL